MDFVTYQQAIEITGKNKRTIQRSVSSGKLSYIVESLEGKEIKLFNRAELVALHGQVSPVSPVTTPLTNIHQADYQVMAEIISRSIVEAQQPLLEKISELTKQITEITHQLESSKGERIDTPKGERIDTPKGERIDTPKGERIDTPKGERIDTPNYLDDIPTFIK